MRDVRSGREVATASEDVASVRDGRVMGEGRTGSLLGRTVDEA